eukprot:CAMPEP_0170628380 /NCGR_PEP_ID=MMETSP0224-20130122/32641_1 /TAXON_ID=285029 /ORGANISM="Togula jolla, Strain CCCM 725" /LENGTH=455 /DNA_ID=CAMNT_0010955777 /DNA_START=1 /DNA_END=1368 /DNA_ORIENTATION=-
MAGSTLDMTLDDVIKSKTKTGEASTGRRRGGNRRGGGGSKNAPGGKAAKDRSSNEKKEGAAKTPAGPGRFARSVMTSHNRARAIGPAMKAAAAAAAATATKGSAAPSGSRAPAKAAAASASTAALGPVKASETGVPGAPARTEDKLAMSLEEVIKGQGSKRPEKAAAQAAPGTGGRARKRGSRRGQTSSAGGKKQQADVKGTGKVRKTKAKSKTEGGSSGNRAWSGPAWNSDRMGSNRGSSSWKQEARENERRWGPGSGMYADWSSGPKRKVDRGIFESEKRSRLGPVASRSGLGLERHDPDRIGGWGSRAERSAAWGSLGGWSRIGGDLHAGGSSGSTAAGWNRAWPTRDAVARNEAPEAGRRDRDRDRALAALGNKTGGSSLGGVRIRVTGVPTNLDWRDVQEAFEDTGRVLKCEVKGGVAWITYKSALEAKKAVQTFDRGELNGQTIYVELE